MDRAPKPSTKSLPSGSPFWKRKGRKVPHTLFDLRLFYHDENIAYHGRGYVSGACAHPDKGGENHPGNTFVKSGGEDRLRGYIPALTANAVTESGVVMRYANRDEGAASGGHKHKEGQGDAGMLSRRRVSAPMNTSVRIQAPGQSDLSAMYAGPEGAEAACAFLQDEKHPLSMDLGAAPWGELNDNGNRQKWMARPANGSSGATPHLSDPMRAVTVHPACVHEKAAYGLVVRRKVGTAVVRNRIKRRLRHAWAQAVHADHVQAGIIVVKDAALATMPFPDLIHALGNMISTPPFRARPV